MCTIVGGNPRVSLDFAVQGSSGQTIYFTTGMLANLTHPSQVQHLRTQPLERCYLIIDYVLEKMQFSKDTSSQILIDFGDVGQVCLTGVDPDGVWAKRKVDWKPSLTLETPELFACFYPENNAQLETLHKQLLEAKNWKAKE